MKEFLPLILGGLVLFLYGISRLSQELQNVFSVRAKSTIKKYTSNIFSALIIGTILTIILGSSSALIILVIIFINSKVLSFKQAIGLIMGANIGTTFSSQIIALDIAQFSIAPLIIGLIIEVFTRNDKIKKIGTVLLYFGMLFFGLYIIQESVTPLRDSTLFTTWVERVDSNYFEGALIGGLITLIIQSSSGTVGIAIILGKQQLLSAAGGIAIMLGSELGTCSDTLIATIKGSRQAIKAGLFHLFFNLTTITLGLLFLIPFVQLVRVVSIDSDIGSQIANAHILFNLLGVLIFLPFVSLAEKMLNWLLPDKII